MSGICKNGDWFSEVTSDNLSDDKEEGNERNDNQFFMAALLDF